MAHAGASVLEQAWSLTGCLFRASAILRIATPMAAREASGRPATTLSMDTSVWARVLVESPTLSPSAMTTMLGIEPSKSFERGKPCSPSSRSTNKRHAWVLESPRLPPGSDPTPLAKDLLTRIGMSCMTLRGRVRRKVYCRLEVCFGLVAKDSAPVLDPDTARSAATQGLAVMVGRTYPYERGTQKHWHHAHRRD